MMAPEKQYMLWTSEDVDSLNTLYQQGYSNERIARCLERSPRAIKHAVKHLLVQETLHHGARATAKKYGLSEDDLQVDIVPYKYYPYQTPKMSYCPIVTLFFSFTIFSMITLYGKFGEMM